MKPNQNRAIQQATSCYSPPGADYICIHILLLQAAWPQRRQLNQIQARLLLRMLRQTPNKSVLSEAAIWGLDLSKYKRGGIGIPPQGHPLHIMVVHSESVHSWL